jgi:uncharacterized protein YndB with AHSA1/START domain
MNVEIQGDAISGEVEIAAPPEAVFDAFTDPEQLTEWWGSADTYRTFNWKVDLRTGGSYSCQAQDPKREGPGATVEGRYLEVNRPHKLVYTWKPSWDPGPETVVEMTFEETPGGTRVRLLHSGFSGRVESQQGHVQGWLRVVGWLREHCQSKEKS